MALNPMNFLDFHEIFINELFGSLALFMVFIIVVIVLVSMRFRIPFEVMGMLMMLFILVVTASYGITALLALVASVAAAIFFWQYSRKMGGT